MVKLDDFVGSSANLLPHHVKVHGLRSKRHFGIELVDTIHELGSKLRGVSFSEETMKKPALWLVL